jgi:Tfp pilus assembly protein PilF/tRNA A-37 threonylcarbamoyl transferase component Bud32
MSATNHSLCPSFPDPSHQLDPIVQEFEEAWRAGRRPAIEEHLPADGGRRAVLVHLVHVDLEYRLKAGEAARVEDYLQRFPELVGDPATLLDLIAAEYDQRRRRQPGLSAAEYLERFPQLEDQLGQRLATPPRRGPSDSSSFCSGETVQVTPCGRAGQDPPPAAAALSRYRPLRLHSRGGLGEVLVAQDQEFRREVALKRIQEEHADDPESRRRFLREAEITGRLEHPGIVPAYGLTQDEAGRPCYAMRLIQGESLREAIRRFHEADRAGRDPGERRLALRELLGRFVDVCQAVAYAHSRGVIHRDLKPHNIMLGKYGETLVVDWGLAKQLGRDDEGQADEEAPAAAGDPGATKTGAVVGTPAYMSPEQAQGRRDEVGPASDVYSLGATLYQLLTGLAPFQGGSWVVLAGVQRGELVPPRRRKREVPRALEAVCLRAMALRPGDRYASALALAEEVEHWLADEPVSAYREPWWVRLGRWTRRHKPAVAAVAAAVLVALLLGGAGAWWARRQAEQRQTDKRERAVEAALAAALDKATAMERQARWAEARAVLEQAASRLGEGKRDDLRRRLEGARQDLDLAARLDAVYLKRATLVKGRFDLAGADRDYAAAFRHAGLGAVGENTAQVAARVRGSAVRAELVAALDDWAYCLGRRGTRQTWVLAVARKADPDPWRDRCRNPRVWNSKLRLERLARAVRAWGVPPRFLVVLGMRLQGLGGDAEALLRAAHGALPGDFWVNFTLANALKQKGKVVEAVGYYRAALALRPGTPAVLNNLGEALQTQGKLGEAKTAYRRALALDPKYAQAHSNLGNALKAQGRLVEAVRAYRQAIALDRTYAKAYYNLGAALTVQGDLAGAIASYRQAIRLQKDYPKAYTNLGIALFKRGDVAGAIAAYRRAIALNPREAQAFTNLGIALHAQGKLGEAVRAYRRALALDPGYAALALNNLGNALRATGKLEEAVKAYRRAIALDPKHAAAHNNLGTALRAQGKLDEAVAEYRRALALDPKFAHTHGALGQVLLSEGRFAEARRATRRSLRILPADHPLRRVLVQQLRRCQQLLALDRKLTAVLKGEAKPDGAAEQLSLAILCQHYKKRFAAAARFYAGALAAKPELGADMKNGHRYNAACAAALAVAGKGIDAGKLAAEEKSRLRGQALKWLQADLAWWGKRLAAGKPGDRREAQQTLRHWQQDPDLAGVRTWDELARLPEGEAKAWAKLWIDVAALLRRAQGAK